MLTIAFTHFRLILVPILYPLKIPENQMFCGVFRVYKIGTLTRNGLIHSSSEPKSILQFEILAPGFLTTSQYP